MEALLNVEQVCKSFGGVVTADKVCMKVYPGEVHGLIGPNGAGKTTLLNLISGIYSVDGGNIYFGDTDVTLTPSYIRAKMGLGRTFQSPRFLQRSSIHDNLMLGVDLAESIGHVKSFFKRRNQNIKEEIRPLLEIADFTFQWDDDINALPYGRRKLLEIIRSLLTNPRIMLVDEPAAGLNNKEIENAMALINLAARERGIGVVLIEHSMDMIMNICDEITVLSFGKVIAEGNPIVISGNEAVITAYLGRERDAQDS